MTTGSAFQAERIAEIFKNFFPQGEIGSLIAGEIVAGSGAEMNLTDPATGKVLLLSKMPISQ